MTVATCPRCGGPMQAGVAIACGRAGAVDIPLPACCPSRECQRQRDAEAIQNAIEKGLIDP